MKFSLPLCTVDVTVGLSIEKKKKILANNQLSCFNY